MPKTYIHYGSPRFSIELFEPIKNSESIFTKPIGGLWASDINAKYGWIDWCRSEDYRVDQLIKSFIFDISDNAEILTIDSVSKLKTLPIIKETISLFGQMETIYLDFEKLSEQYDAIEVLISSDQELYYTLYGWDCDSILIMNPDIIEPYRR